MKSSPVSRLTACILQKVSRGKRIALRELLVDPKNLTHVIAVCLTFQNQHVKNKIHFEIDLSVKNINFRS
jgi:hypothetical protein